MAEDSRQNPVCRKQRVQRMKRMIVSGLFIAIILPIIGCICLFARVDQLNRTIEALSIQIEQINDTINKLYSEKEDLEISEVDVTEEGVEVNASLPSENETVGLIEKDETQAAHKVYLTFDDGPSCYTDEILDILERYNVKATFFVVGKEDETSKEALKRIVEEGHSLGMHSYSHKYGELYASEENFSEDFYRIQNFLQDVTGVESRIYRFPGGSSNTVSRLPMKDFASFLEEQGVTFYDWNVASGDGNSALLSVQTLVKNSLIDVDQRETSIILLHDSADKRTTIEALPIIIENILAMEDTAILPIDEETKPVQHINKELTD